MKLKSVKIGDTVVPHGLFLGPMAGFTDLEFRRICAECGAEFTVTEMISAKAVCFGDKKTWELARLEMQDSGEDAAASSRHGRDRSLRSLGDTLAVLAVADLYPSAKVSRRSGIQVLSPQGSTPSPSCDISTHRLKSADNCLLTLGRLEMQDSGEDAAASSRHGRGNNSTMQQKSADDCLPTLGRCEMQDSGEDAAASSRHGRGNNSAMQQKSADDCLPTLVGTGLQVFGHEPDDIEIACRKLMEWYGSGECSQGLAMRPSAIDINMGCPVKKIVGSGDGSALMKSPDLCRKLVEAARRGAGDVPVTVKIRAGFDAEHKNAAEVARACVKGGAAAVFVHGRTREQFYAPSSDNTVIAAVRDALPPEIPVIGNGDVDSVEAADRMLRETGCDGIMIGRAALGDPWLFGRIAAAAEGVILPEPDIEERLAMARRLCEMVCERYGEGRGVPMCRGRAGHFIRGISGAAAMRDRLCHATTLAEVKDILTL